MISGRTNSSQFFVRRDVLSLPQRYMSILRRAPRPTLLRNAFVNKCGAGRTGSVQIRDKRLNFDRFVTWFLLVSILLSSHMDKNRRSQIISRLCLKGFLRNQIFLLLSCLIFYRTIHGFCFNLVFSNLWYEHGFTFDHKFYRVVFFQTFPVLNLEVWLEHRTSQKLLLFSVDVTEL